MKKERLSAKQQKDLKAKKRRNHGDPEETKQAVKRDMKTKKNP